MIGFNLKIGENRFIKQRYTPGTVQSQMESCSGHHTYGPKSFADRRKRIIESETYQTTKSPNARLSTIQENKFLIMPHALCSCT